MNLYREEILDHYKNPRNFGDLKGVKFKAREANASCGDLIELSLRLKPSFSGKKIALQDDSVIENVKFKGVGCAISIAASSLLTEELKGKTVKEVKAIDDEFMRELVGIDVSSTRMNCLTLPLRALEKCLSRINKD